MKNVPTLEYFLTIEFSRGVVLILNNLAYPRDDLGDEVANIHGEQLQLTEALGSRRVV